MFFLNDFLFRQEKSLTDGQNDALRMFDSNGPFPFLQEGRLQDTIPIHFCDFLTGFEQGITNQLLIIQNDTPCDSSFSCI